MFIERHHLDFAKILDFWPEKRIRELIDRAGAGDVERALGRESLHPEVLAALLSPQAVPYLEDMAQAGHRITRCPGPVIGRRKIAAPLL